MRRSLLVVGLFSAAVSLAPALAESLQSVLTSDDIKEEIFGVHLEGVAGISDLPWTECIEPDGDTIYSYQGKTLTGKMRINEEYDLVCFDYEGRGQSPLNCFSVMRDGKGGYIFSGGAGNGGQFKTTAVHRNINSCPAPLAAIS